MLNRQNWYNSKLTARVNNRGVSLAHTVAAYGTVDDFRLLIQFEADLNQQVWAKNVTPIMVATSCGRHDIIQGNQAIRLLLLIDIRLFNRK